MVAHRTGPYLNPQLCKKIGLCIAHTCSAKRTAQLLGISRATLYRRREENSLLNIHWQVGLELRRELQFIKRTCSFGPFSTDSGTTDSQYLDMCEAEYDNSLAEALTRLSDQRDRTNNTLFPELDYSIDTLLFPELDYPIFGEDTPGIKLDIAIKESVKTQKSAVKEKRKSFRQQINELFEEYPDDNTARQKAVNQLSLEHVKLAMSGDLNALIEIEDILEEDEL